ncbi:unnamed protein product [Bursaphelenchus okinawaensis]|uniref:Mab-21 domain-containing protein n=1 Tax=Bursaphelenchus okinawaensis TaxID=465554 RepID=A0A811KQ19_9BILA|nr:unnamed protein product [Bursaphelenchus okinawaensis]CAG9107726.1 unnamed protein product [Bursaphelenchus okinawaensis]
MLGQNAVTCQQINNFLNKKVHTRRNQVQQSIHQVVKIVQDVLKDVELQEPRFIPTLLENNGRYEGLIVHSPEEYEVFLYLNQMGVFNFVDDGSIQGCAVLKLSDGRKRSMSLWVEFITASGYLSARKIRSRFQALVMQSCEKPQFRDKCKVLNDNSDVKLKIYDKFVVTVTCAFRCNGIWPRSASHWPAPGSSWPAPEIVKEVHYEGFDLLSKDMSGPFQNQLPPQNAAKNQAAQSSMESDAWAISMVNAEDHLLRHVNRRMVYAILKTLRDRHLNFAATPVSNYIIKTLVLYECEKHINDAEWHEFCLGDRVIGVLLQLVSCLQCHKCPHYFIPSLDLFRGHSSHLLDHSAKAVWALVRQLLLSSRALECL